MRRNLIFLSIVVFLLVAACNLPFGAEDEEDGAYTPTGEGSTTIPTPASSAAIAEGAYYVGQTGCRDTGAGDEQTPSCSFEAALDRLQPGDMLVIQAGVYTDPLLVDGVAGTADAPIVVRGETRDVVIFDGGCPDFPCSIDDINSDQNWEGMVFIMNGDYVTLSDITVRK